MGCEMGRGVLHQVPPTGRDDGRAGGHRRSLHAQSVGHQVCTGGCKTVPPLPAPGCPPRFRPDAGRGGFRFTCGPSLDGGLEEFCECCARRAFKSATSASRLAIRASYRSNTTHSTAWTGGRICSHNSTGIGGVCSVCALLPHFSHSAQV